MASGVKVSDAVSATWDQMKIKKNIKFFLMTITNGNTSIEVSKVEAQGDYASFLASLPKGDCIYAAYDFDYTLLDGGQRNKLIFVCWNPDDAPIKQKMLYASSKDALKKKLVGHTHEIAGNGMDDLDYDEVLKHISAGRTK